MTFSAMKRRINVYTCPVCFGETVTIDRDKGVTPFMLRCRAKGEPSDESCPGMALSSMYRPHPGCGAPAWEWYRPSREEVDAASPGMQQHASMGGLFIRPLGGGSR